MALSGKKTRKKKLPLETEIEVISPGRAVTGELHHPSYRCYFYHKPSLHVKNYRTAGFRSVACSIMKSYGLRAMGLSRKLFGAEYASKFDSAFAASHADELFKPLRGFSKTDARPSSASISSRRLYLAVLSLRQRDPVLICPPPMATAKSARKVSSVSPDL